MPRGWLGRTGAIATLIGALVMATSVGVTARVAATTPDDDAAERIEFAPGTEYGSVSGLVEPGTTNHYVVRASAGQTMTIVVASIDQNAGVTVIAPGGEVLPSGGPLFVGALPATGDYAIQVGTVPGGAATPYGLVVFIPGPASAEPPPSESVAPSIDRYWELNGICRGGSGDDQATWDACHERESLGWQLRIGGWCLREGSGPVDENEVYRDWFHCGTTDLTDFLGRFTTAWQGQDAEALHQLATPEAASQVLALGPGLVWTWFDSTCEVGTSGAGECTFYFRADGEVLIGPGHEYAVDYSEAAASPHGFVVNSVAMR